MEFGAMLTDAIWTLLLWICLSEGFSGENLALNKTSWQKTTGFGGPTERANDGNRENDHQVHYCAHSATDDAGNWWIVDLGSLFPVAQVVIYNRATHGHRLSDLSVDVSITPDIADFQSRCYNYTGTASDGEILDLNCLRPICGRYVKIFKYSASTLTLCEVEVYENKNLNNVQHGRLSAAISTHTCIASSQVDCVSRCIDNAPTCHSVNYNTISFECQFVADNGTATSHADSWSFVSPFVC